MFYSILHLTLFYVSFHFTFNVSFQFYVIFHCILHFIFHFILHWWFISFYISWCILFYISCFIQFYTCENPLSNRRESNLFYLCHGRTPYLNYTIPCPKQPVSRVLLVYWYLNLKEVSKQVICLLLPNASTNDEVRKGCLLLPYTQYAYRAWLFTYFYLKSSTPKGVLKGCLLTFIL